MIGDQNRGPLDKAPLEPVEGFPLTAPPLVRDDRVKVAATPAAVPAPSLKAGPTIGQLKDWALAGLSGVSGHITVERARALVVHSVDSNWAKP